jgi:hypothetical protein
MKIIQARLVASFIFLISVTLCTCGSVSVDQTSRVRYGRQVFIPKYVTWLEPCRKMV